MIIDLKDIIDDDLIYNYFSQKVDHAMKNPSSLKMTPNILFILGLKKMENIMIGNMINQKN